MFCKYCGCELAADEQYCHNCGNSTGNDNCYYTIHHPVTPVNIWRPYASNEAKIFGIITSILIGFAMIGGGIFGIVKLTIYTHWVWLGGVFTILGGVSCVFNGIVLVCRLLRNKDND